MRRGASLGSTGNPARRHYANSNGGQVLFTSMILAKLASWRRLPPDRARARRAQRPRARRSRLRPPRHPRRRPSGILLSCPGTSPGHSPCLSAQSSRRHHDHAVGRLRHALAEIADRPRRIVEVVMLDAADGEARLFEELADRAGQVAADREPAPDRVEPALPGSATLVVDRPCSRNSTRPRGFSTRRTSAAPPWDRRPSIGCR